MDSKLSDPGSVFLEKKKSLEFRELSSDAPSPVEALAARGDEGVGASGAEGEAAPDTLNTPFGTITFRGDSVSLAELKRRSMSNRFAAFWENATMRFKIRFRQNIRRKLLRIALVLLALLLIGGGAWGASWYAKRFSAIPAADIFAEQPELLLRVNINPDSDAYRLLEEHLAKFPGYRLLVKALDPVGEGKTLSGVFQDSLKTFNIDFEGEVKPVLGDTAFVGIPSLRPIGEGLRKTSVSFGGSLEESYVRLLGKNDRRVASLDRSLDAPQVLGEWTVGENPSETTGFSPSEPLDFVAVIPVRDISEAIRVFEKMAKENRERITPLEYRGFSYSRVEIQKDGKEPLPGDVSRFVQFRELYQALVGGNLISASSERDLKAILDRQTDRRTLSLLLAPASDPLSLEGSDFRELDRALRIPDASHTLVSVFLDTPSREFLGTTPCTGDSCADPMEFFRYPERIKLGVSFALTEGGFETLWTQDANDQKATPATPKEERFSARLPQKADERWLNVFAEEAAPKERFYDFKRSQLTDRGREEYEKWREAIRMAAGVDIERDIIDRFTGNIAFALLTKGSLEPEGVLVADIDDPQAVRKAVEKSLALVRTLLQSELETIRTSISEDSCGDWGYSNSPNRSWKEQCLAFSEERKKVSLAEQAKIEAMIASLRLAETATPEGTVYSFKLSNEFPYSLLSFDFAFLGKTLVLGSHFSAVEAFLREMKGGSEEKIGENVFYKNVSREDFAESASRVFAVPSGVWDAFLYFKNLLVSNISQSLSALSGGGETDVRVSENMREMDDWFFAVGAIARTVEAFGSEALIRDGFATSASRAVIKSLPAEEKVRAEGILERTLSALGNAREKAQAAAFKSSVSSLVPIAIIQCDEGNINPEAFFNIVNPSCFSKNDIVISRQSCGSSGDGRFEFSVSSNCLPTRCTGVATEQGVEFSPC